MILFAYWDQSKILAMHEFNLSQKENVTGGFVLQRNCML